MTPSPDEPPTERGSGQFAECWISFGGNIGDVQATFSAALALISLHTCVRLGLRSGLYSTAPMGSQAGSPFINSVCGLSTRLSPNELLRVLQSVENQLGRVRNVRWGPRTLDLDLLSYGSRIINEPDLIVPHPALTYRRFVLDPLVEVCPNWQHPVCLETADKILWRLKSRPLRVALLDVDKDQIKAVQSQLQSRFPDLELFNDCQDLTGFLPIRLNPSAGHCQKTIVNLQNSPGCLLEKLTSAFTAIFDAPTRVSDW